MTVKRSVRIEFDNNDAAEHFLSWLSGSGEQMYWEWMKSREQEEDGDITALKFDYTNGLIVKTKCGRQDKK